MINASFEGAVRLKSSWVISVGGGLISHDIGWSCESTIYVLLVCEAETGLNSTHVVTY